MNRLYHSYTGKVVDGVIVLEEGIALPEGAQVNIELLSEEPALHPTNSTATTGQKAASPLGELLLKFAGVADDLLADMAKNHDHYLYGAPKKEE